jgi:creatinine amidohydrolase/Fe(II)-dependent formamide hydrolase-like protein
VVKQKYYLRAELSFPEAGPSSGSGWRLLGTDRHRHCALSSGGKDSLLSFGLLDEAGFDVHPIFVNESGRHWFTAINAYRFFRQRYPNTARVWVNSDRVFNWMLKRMPFVRRDFAAVRADIYPIRLWTVAVFLFGALPLMRKRGIGRLIIGDEFDTTEKKTFEGIPHYDGLYDQSIYFDRALSRYFLRKGWAVSQFSILRPLSELLIEKILAERYPRLLAQQVSCHAAHKDGDRVRPCGRCEKCRRIVAMLTALGVGPELCGYTASQIDAGLKGFVDHGTHQEEAGMRQVGHMLVANKAVEATGTRPKYFTEQPEILKLRFDGKKAPLDAIPVDLRRPLFKMCLAHANGAVRRTGRRWETFDLLSDPDIEVPFAFELDPQEPSRPEKTDDAALRSDQVVGGELTWPLAEKRLAQVDVALLPVGAIEQHGAHLPLDTDAFDAEYLARKVAEACSDPKPLVMPLVSYGVSYHHDDFKGTISISNNILAGLIYEIGISTARNGIRKLVIINGHGGNSPALNHAAQMINRDAGIFVCVDTGDTSDADIYRIVETPNDVHAGEIETSTSLAVRPDLVNMERAVRFIPEFSSHYLDFTSKRGVSWYGATSRISSVGVMGDPTRASAEKGKKIWEITIAHLVGLVEDLKNLTLEEIHQRKN